MAAGGPSGAGRGLLVGLVGAAAAVSALVVAWALLAPHAVPAFLGPLVLLVPVCLIGFAVAVLRRRR